MRKSNEVKEPVKLSSVLELFDEDEHIDIRITFNSGKYVDLHTETETLRNLDVVQDCFVDNISTVDPSIEGDGFYILAHKTLKEVKIK